MEWFNKFIDFLFGPEKKPPALVKVIECAKVETGMKITAIDAQRCYYHKTVPLNSTIRKGQLIAANLETWNKTL